MTGQESASGATLSENAEAAHGSPSSHGGETVPAAPVGELFTRNELEEFDADDVKAGGTIGKMLALFFLYTVIVMSIVAWWTYYAVKGP